MMQYEAPEQEPNFNGPRRPFLNTWNDFRFKNILLIVVLAVLLGVVAFTSYKLGVQRGIDVGNADRTAFYEQRIKELTNYGSSTGSTTSTTPATNTTPGAVPAISTGAGTLARIDKIDGDKMTVLILDKTGLPTGVSLVISLNQQPPIWKSDRTDSAILAPGQNILFVGDTDKAGNVTVRNVLILPAASQ